MEYPIEKGTVNPDTLDEALCGALGSAYNGLSAGGSSGLRLHLADSVTDAQIEVAHDIVEAHDPDALTPAQQQRADREAAYAALRAQVDALDLTQPLSAEDADVVARFNALSALLGK